MLPAWDSSAIFLNKMSGPVRERVIDQVPLPDNTGDPERRRWLLPELYIIRYFFSTSHDESDSDGGKEARGEGGGGDEEAMAIDFLSDSTNSLLSASTAISAVRAITTELVTTAFEIVDTIT